MKRRVCFSLLVVCLLSLLAANAVAQEQDLKVLKRKAAEEAAAQNVEVDAKIREELVKVIGAKIGFEINVVKGAPYSATAEAETIQTLVDGNRIRNKTTTLVYRDSEGRTRRESLGKAQSAATEVFISDPAGGVNFFLDTRQRFAIKSQVTPQELELDKVKLKFAAAAEIKERMQGSEQTLTDMPKKKKRLPVSESLGQQVIEGVLCEGSRSTFIIPADAVGNEQPITIVNEQWYSPELQVYVLTKQSDPRVGETIYRLTNINRSEPNRALFETPAGYTLKDALTPPAKMKERPEEER